MSHFLVTVLVKPGTSNKDSIAAQAERMLAPFQENNMKDKDKGRYGYWENPQAKWDWYVIGGRWDGVYMPEGYEPGNQYENNVDDNVVLVKDLPPDTTSFAFLTPEGEWIERGSVGWWAIVTGEVSEEEWKKQCKTILERYSDCYAVAVDCHI